MRYGLCVVHDSEYLSVLMFSAVTFSGVFQQTSSKFGIQREFRHEILDLFCHSGKTGLDEPYGLVALVLVIAKIWFIGLRFVCANLGVFIFLMASTKEPSGGRALKWIWCLSRRPETTGIRVQRRGRRRSCFQRWVLEKSSVSLIHWKHCSGRMKRWRILQDRSREDSPDVCLLPVCRDAKASCHH